MRFACPVAPRAFGHLRQQHHSRPGRPDRFLFMDQWPGASPPRAVQLNRPGRPSYLGLDRGCACAASPRTGRRRLRTSPVQPLLRHQRQILADLAQRAGHQRQPSRRFGDPGPVGMAARWARRQVQGSGHVGRSPHAPGGVPATPGAGVMHPFDPPGSDAQTVQPMRQRRTPIGDTMPAQVTAPAALGIFSRVFGGHQRPIARIPRTSALDGRSAAQRPERRRTAPLRLKARVVSITSWGARDGARRPSPAWPELASRPARNAVPDHPLQPSGSGPKPVVSRQGSRARSAFT